MNEKSLHNCDAGENSSAIGWGKPYEAGENHHRFRKEKISCALSTAETVWVRLIPHFYPKKKHRPKTRTDRRSCLSPDDSRRKITQSTCNFCGVSTSRLSTYLYHTTNLGVQRLLTGVYLSKLQPLWTVLRKKSMSSRKSQKTYVFLLHSSYNSYIDEKRRKNPPI